MDPNTTLAEILRLVRDAEKIDPLMLIDELINNVRSLDEWLSKGGFPPDAWRHAR